MLFHYLSTALRHFKRHKVTTGLNVLWPLVYIAMRGHLNLFAHRSGLTPLPFLVALAITIVVAWCAVLVQTTRAARLRPATVLRYE